MYPPAGEPRKTCHLCGLGLGASPVLEKTQDGTIGFCCPGCRQVFLLLSAAAGVLPERFRETELYRVCLESGIIRPDGPPPRNRDSGPLPPDLPPLEATYRVEGM
ncbi:MAG: hypothetical protein ABSC19_07670, partial [Syntrophorhabdales bacterium]